MSCVDIDVHIPRLNPVSEASARRAYANGLACEIAQAAGDLAQLRVRQIAIHGATRLDDRSLNHVLVALKHLATSEHAFKVAEVEPHLLSNGLMTPLRNFGIDRYDVDLGSLNAAEFHSLRRAYDQGVYDLLRKLFDAYGLTSWRAQITIGMPVQSARTLSDCLDKLEDWSPAEVKLSIFDPAFGAGPSPDDADAPFVLAGTEPLVARTCELLDHADAALESMGYHRVGVLEYARDACAVRHAGARDDEPGAPHERWGFGLGAVSMIDGCMVRNTSSLDRYLRATSLDATSPTDAQPGLGLSLEHAQAVRGCQEQASDELDGLVEQVVRLDASSMTRLLVWDGLNSPQGLCLFDVPDISAPLASFLEVLVSEGLADRSGNTFLLTTKGVALSGRIRQKLDCMCM